MGIFSKRRKSLKFERRADPFSKHNLLIPREEEEPTPEDPQLAELRGIQIDQLRKAVAEREEFDPFLLAEMGLERDAEGKLRKTDRPQDALLRVLEERALQSARGELSPAQEADLKRDRARTESFLSQRLGPGFRLSTPGLESESRFNIQSNIQRDRFRREGLGQALSAVSQRRGLLSREQQQRLGILQSGITPRLGLIGAGGIVQEPLQAKAALEFAGEQQKRLTKAQESSEVAGLAGTVIGAYLGGPAGAVAGKTAATEGDKQISQ